MAEFKKISDVDVINTLTDNDNVLIVGADGALKQTASSNVKGGASGYFLTLSEDNCQIDWDYYGILCNENYDELYNVLIAGGSAWIDFALMDGMQPVRPYESATEPLLPFATNTAGWVVHISDWSISDVGLFLTCPLFGDFFVVCFPNGSHNLPPVELPEK